MNADGSNKRNLANSPQLSEHAEYHSAVWTPDGRVSYWHGSCPESGGVELRAINADGSGQETLFCLTEVPAQSEIFWSPDGKKLAFRAYEGIWNLYVINADGTGLKQVIHGAGENSYVNQVAWSPDALLGSASAPKRGFSHDMSTKVSRECGLDE